MKRKKNNVDPLPPKFDPPSLPQVPGAPVIDPKKRIKVNEDEIKNLSMLRGLFDKYIYDKGMNRNTYQLIEKSINMKLDDKSKQINTLLQTYKAKYKIVGDPIDWDPKTNELILK